MGRTALIIQKCFRMSALFRNFAAVFLNIEMAKKIAEHIGVGIEFVQTTWPTLTADVLTDPQTFDLAIGGITITDTRKETMLMSEGYLANGKTILCRSSEADRYK